ncbi:Hisactophilin c49s mutant phototropin phy3 fusion protein [Rutstroemia sp. NJR-2017a BBW]|nr:Hisactophilin c49s mutant phototropin phy3 fusion protein [Rutstroemia sp. NJR-2017a BBW]
MNLPSIADRRLGFQQPYNQKPSFTPPMKIDEADVEEGGAEVVDIPFHRTRPTTSPSGTGNKPSKFSMNRFDPRKTQASESANSPPRILQVQAQHPARTSSINNEEHREMEEERPDAEDRLCIRDSRPSITSTQSPASPSTQRSRSRAGSFSSYQTNATSLPPLQSKGPLEDIGDQLEPLNEEDLDPGSFDLVAPPPVEGTSKRFSLEKRSEQLFSTEHLRVIFADPALLLRFTSYLGAYRSSSIPILIYYLDTVKALKAISYSNAITEALEPIPGFDFTASTALKTLNAELEEKANKAFDVLVREDLPAYITHTFLQTVSISIQRRVTGSLPAHLREASEGLAEVFCLTDPSRPDNPIVFASEDYVIGRNCRFLQGPKTNPFSVRRIREKVEAGQEHCETFLNYRRDGSPFMNMLMCAPLCDSRGTIRYFIGAQVDISGLVKDCTDLESLQRLVEAEERPDESQAERTANSDLGLEEPAHPVKDEFQELSEMLNMQELETVRKWGGRMHKEGGEDDRQESGYTKGNWPKPRLHITSTSPDGSKENSGSNRISGKLSGIYENYLLVRPYPSLRVLFASPTLRVPGILQSPFMSKIGGSNRVREELTQALADGRGVTAKVRWVTKDDVDGRSRWIHCTPLIGSNGAIGVWMIVIVDDEHSQPSAKRFRQAPPVDPSGEFEGFCDGEWGEVGEGTAGDSEEYEELE